MSDPTKQLNLYSGTIYPRQPPLIKTTNTTYSINAASSSNPRLKSATAFLTNLNDFTVEFFILTSMITFGTVLSIRDNGSNLNNVMLNVTINRNNDGRLSLDTWDGIQNPASQVTSINPINDGNIHHIVITFNSSTKILTLIIDGMVNNSITQTGTIPTSACYLYLFNDNETNNSPSGMIIDDLVVYPFLIPNDTIGLHTNSAFNQDFYGFLETSATSNNLTLSNNNLTATSTNVGGISKLSHYKSYAKWYIEIKIDSLIGSAGVGFCTIAESINNTLGDTINSWSLWNNGDLKTNNNIINVPELSFTTNDIIGIAFDLNTGKVWFSKNGIFATGSNPVTGTNPQFSGIIGKIKPALSPNSVGNVLSIITNPANFNYTIPANFIPGYYFNALYKKPPYYKAITWNLNNNSYSPPNYTSIQWEIR